MRTPDTRVAGQRALEALRNGVPNSDAVRALGCMQPAVLDAFSDRLDRLGVSDPEPPLVDGCLIAGGFGAGKSHTLSYLEQKALERGFIVSRVVISKETPMHDAAKLFVAAIREARMPNGRGSLIDELAPRLDYRAAATASFVEWALRKQPHGILAATVAIHERSNDDELSQQIVNYWSGEKLAVQEIRNALKNLNVPGKHDVKTVKVADLAPVRFEFAARLARAVGFKGWVILLDEVELVARYSLLQRARSYAALASWLGALPGHGVRGTVFLAAITDDFALSVLDQRGDAEKAPERAKAKGDTRSLAMAAMAETGMDLIEKKAISLNPPNDDTLRASYERLRDLYSAAYGTVPSGVFQPEVGSHRPMRSYVRRWISVWDMQRLDPQGVADTEEEELQMVQGEDPELSAESDQEQSESA